MGKPKPRRASGRFEVEWVTVSYRTLVRWSSLLLALGAIAAAIYFGGRLRSETRHRDAERVVNAVERELRVARVARTERDPAPELVEAESRLRSARERLAGGEFAAAAGAAAEARVLIRQLGSEHTDRARMLRVEGQVQVKQVGTVDWTDARVGTALGPGDLLRTGVSSGAQFVNLDGSIVTLRSDSVLRIERSGKDRVSGKTEVAVVVDSGQLAMATSDTASEGSTSEVRTANASARVERKSVLDVDAKDGHSRIDVLEGRARVRAGGAELDLGSNERVSVSAAGAVERRKLPGIPQLLNPQQYKLLLLRDLGSRPLELEWESILDARAYKVELAQSPLFTRLVRRWEHVTTSYVPAGKLANGRYYWRVTAMDRDNVEGGPSPGGVFQVSDAAPEGEPPPLEITSRQPLGEGMFLFEGRTQPGVFLSIDDGSRLMAIQPSQSGEFKHVVTLTREGRQAITVTARSSEGLERRIVHNVDLKFQ